MNSPKSSLFLLVLLGLLVSGCATTSSLMVPVLPAPVHTLKQPPPARLRIPLVVSLPELNSVEKHLAEFVKEDWAKSEKSLTKSLGTTVWWDPLSWDFDGNTLTAHMHVHYKNATGAKDKEAEGLVDEVEKDMKVDLASVLQWNKDWHLEAPDFDEKPGEGKPEASATPQAEEATDDRKGEKLLRKGTAKFHENLKKKTDFKAKAQELWKAIQEPIRMAEDTWLQIKPDQVSVGSSHLVPDPRSPRLETVFEIVAQPNVVIGKRPPPLKEELPPLTDLKPGPEGFHAETNLKISFKEVNKLLIDPKTGILNKALPGSGDHHLKITNIRVYGSGGKLVVEAQVDYQPVLNLSSKPAQLTIYLLGTPTYHEEDQVIDFPDMDFDIQTSDFLVQMAEFISGSGMKEELRKRAVIPVGKKLDDLKIKLNQLLNRPLGHFAKLHTTITSLKMEEAFVSDYGLEGRIALDGDAAVDVNW
jgi:hypothetical protein